MARKETNHKKTGRQPARPPVSKSGKSKASSKASASRGKDAGVNVKKLASKGGEKLIPKKHTPANKAKPVIKSKKVNPKKGAKAPGLAAPAKKQPARMDMAKQSPAKAKAASKPLVREKTPIAVQAVKGQVPSVGETVARRLAERKLERRPVSDHKTPASRTVMPKEVIPDTYQPTGTYNGIIITHDIKTFPARTPYSKEELLELRAALMEERDRLSSHLATLSGVSMEALVSAKEHAGYSVHIAESATDLQTAEANLGVRSIEEERLAQVDEALERIKNHVNHFGLCLSCGNKIGIQRLKARPHAHLCMPCRKRYEEIRSRRGY
jgi:DnaK suppressor protein